MLDVLKQITAAMTAPDQMFAITETEVHGNLMKTWANAPGSLRDLWLSTSVHGERDYLVFPLPSSETVQINVQFGKKPEDHGFSLQRAQRITKEKN